MWHVGVWAIHVHWSLCSSVCVIGLTWLAKRLSILTMTEFLLLLCKQQSDWALNYMLTVLWSFSHLRSKCKPSFNVTRMSVISKGCLSGYVCDALSLICPMLLSALWSPDCLFIVFSFTCLNTQPIIKAVKIRH